MKFDENADPEVKALEFDLQIEENAIAAERKDDEDE